MALLASKRVRKNITAQIFNGGGAAGYGQPTVVAFMKAGIPIPGETDNRFGDAHYTTMFDYCNETLNWSSHDGGGGTNRGNYLGYAVIPASTSNGMFSSDENGMYFSGPLTVTMVAEGEIGSVLVYHPGATTSTTGSDLSTCVIPPNNATGITTNYIAIGEATSSSQYLFVDSPTGIGYSGSVYLKNQTQPRSSSFFYQNVYFVTDSVGTTTSDAVIVSGTYISSSTSVTLESINLKISEAF